MFQFKNNIQPSTQKFKSITITQRKTHFFMACGGPLVCHFDEFLICNRFFSLKWCRCRKFLLYMQLYFHISKRDYINSKKFLEKFAVFFYYCCCCWGLNKADKPLSIVYFVNILLPVHGLYRFRIIIEIIYYFMTIVRDLWKTPVLTRQCDFYSQTKIVWEDYFQCTTVLVLWVWW